MYISTHILCISFYIYEQMCAVHTYIESVWILFLKINGLQERNVRYREKRYIVFGTGRTCYLENSIILSELYDPQSYVNALEERNI